ncbi:MAG TPA: NAD(P)H-dependent oxidoreductase [Steroidobacteraceae bacterium]|nr:NAD(P)H-dependent oxidoreductase [Steroidobacteraceae bacterium]
MTAANDSNALLIVGIGGTARSNSTSERAVVEALRSAERLGAQTRLFDGLFVSGLPLYVPDRTERTEAEKDFIATIRRCHGVIVGTPGYHGSLSGPIKNVLDLLEDTAQDESPYLEGRAFGCVVTAYGWQACGTTLVALRMIAHALRAWPTPFGAALNASTPLFETDGTCIDGKIAQQLAIVASQVVEFARHRAAGLGRAAPG